MKEKVVKLLVPVFLLATILVNVIPVLAADNDCRAGCIQCASGYYMDTENCPAPATGIYYRCEQGVPSNHCCVNDQTTCVELN